MKFDTVIHTSPKAVCKPELLENVSSFSILIQHAVITANKILVSAEAQAYAFPPLTQSLIENTADQWTYLFVFIL